MTTPAELRRLIERLEKNDESNRQLSFDIGGALNAPPHYRVNYLERFDYARLLLPDGFGWGVDCDPNKQCSAHICQLTARGVRVRTATHRWPIIAYADTVERALCIAALRARLAQAEQEKCDE